MKCIESCVGVNVCYTQRYSRLGVCVRGREGKRVRVCVCVSELFPGPVQEL